MTAKKQNTSQSQDADKTDNPNTTDTDNHNPPEKDTQNQANKQKEKYLVVVARRKSFRRAGFDFGEQETRLRVDDLSDEQVAMIKAEPMLVVTETEA